jgi:hypothetical protein
MGYPFVGVPVLDILHHGYTTDVVSVRVRPARTDQVEVTGTQQRWTLKELKVKMKTYIKDLIKKKDFKGGEYTETEFNGYLKSDFGSLDSQLRIVARRAPPFQLGAKLNPDEDKFWGFVAGEGPAVLLQAGWNETVTKPMDLGATKLRCRVFCHFGCSSHRRFSPILRRKRWEKIGKRKGIAYYTHRTSYSITGPFWLYYLLTYDNFNAGKSWEPSLDHATDNANAKIYEWINKFNEESKKRHPPGAKLKPYRISK